jgi:hypothetical protein
MVEEIAGSAEFYTDANDSPTAFMSKLYSDLLSRPPNSAELQSDAGFGNNIGKGDVSARLAAAQDMVASVAFRTAEVNSFFDNYLHPTCRQLAAQECTSGSVRTPTPGDLSAALTPLESGSTEESIIAGVLASDQYYQDHQSTQTGFIQGVYEDLLGRAPSDAELSAATTKYTNDFTGHTDFAQAMVGALAYQDHLVSLDYRKLLLRAPYASETITGEGVLGGGVPSLQTPDEILLETIAATPEYYVDAGGSDTAFVARTVDVLLERAAAPADESVYLERPTPHDAAWQIGVAEAILDSSEYRTDFVRGVYESYLTFSDCATETGSPQDDGGLLANIGGTVVVGLLVGALVIGIAVPTILRRRS